MPKRTDINSIMIIGAGPIIIGQACEFDYSGAQAVKVLKKEGYRVVLINSNPATIMTDPVTADHIYLLPLTVVNPSFPGWERDLDYTVEQLGCVGCGALPNYHGYSVYDASGHWERRDTTCPENWIERPSENQFVE